MLVLMGAASGVRVRRCALEAWQNGLCWGLAQAAPLFLACKHSLTQHTLAHPTPLALSSLQGHGLVVDEASLTGESDPVKKGPNDEPWVRSGTQVSTGAMGWCWLRWAGGWMGGWLVRWERWVLASKGRACPGIAFPSPPPCRLSPLLLLLLLPPRLPGAGHRGQRAHVGAGCG